MYFRGIVGSSFWAESEENTNEYVHARMIKILLMKNSEALILTEIIEIRNKLDFICAVSDEKKEAIRGNYMYGPPEGDTSEAQFDQYDDGTLSFSNVLGGGDVAVSDWIYTDSDGIDHLYMCTYEDFSSNYIFVGDDVLGFKEDRFFRWENKLLIAWKNKAVLQCDKNATEVVVPDGIEDLGWNSFMYCEELERIVIPESVVRGRMCNFFNCSKLKEIVMKGNSKLEINSIPECAEIIRE